MDGLTIALERIAREAEERAGFLDLGRLGLTAVPDELLQLAHLRGLNLGSHYYDENGRPRDSASALEPNSVATKLSQLVALTSLQYLSLNGAELSDLAPLKDLSALQRLDCSGCRLDEVSEEYWLQPSLDVLYLYETYIPGVPADVLSRYPLDNCLASLRSHLRDLSNGSVPTTDVKLLVLGNGRVGKTQICRRLGGEEYDEGVTSTHGIIVTPARFLAQTGEDELRLNIWDFGGQDIYPGTHALFTRSNAIFMLVWAPATEDQRLHEYGGIIFRNYPLAYWVDYVRHLGGKDISALIVQTRCDRPEDRAVCPVPEAVLRESFRNYYPLSYSAANNRGRAALDEALSEAVSSLHQHQGIVRIGANRHRVKIRLEQMRDADARSPVEARQYRTITQEQFRQICREENGPSEPKYLLAYLHNAGIVFYREGMFDDCIILDQNWVLEAIYAVFNREKCYKLLRQQRGRFTRSLLELIVWQEFQKEEQELFLSICSPAVFASPSSAETRNSALKRNMSRPIFRPKRQQFKTNSAKNGTRRSLQRRPPFLMISCTKGSSAPSSLASVRMPGSAPPIGREAFVFTRK